MHKKVFSTILCLAVLFSSLINPLSVLAAGKDSVAKVNTFQNEIDLPYKPGEIILKFKTGVSMTNANSVLNQYSLSSEKTVPLINAQLTKIPSDTSVEEVVATLKKNPFIEIAQPNYRYSPQAIMPGDSGFGQLWGLNQANDIDIDAPEAWDFTRVQIPL